MKRNYILLLFVVFFSSLTNAQLFNASDAQLGALSADRQWWKVLHYDLSIKVNPTDKQISGSNIIRFKVIKKPTANLQIDLQLPMHIDSIRAYGKTYFPLREEPSYFFKNPWIKAHIGQIFEFTVYFHGRPQEAVNPPWKGGFIWKYDDYKHPWISVASQGIGASIWWPCKDHQSEKPDEGMDIYITAPADLQAISNGKLKKISLEKNRWKRWHWQVKAPISAYNVALYIGKYAHKKSYFRGKKGKLSLDFYFLKKNLSRALPLFEDTESMLRCFERWMGPYPFYQDGYKWIEAPFLGMEHQSAIAYGNNYQRGYAGEDRSGTGEGLSFDFILIHESAHEWFGNSVTASDLAYNWIHEGLATYAEALYLECSIGKRSSEIYLLGKQHLISNNRPLIARQGFREEGSGDIYDKGAALIHMIRLWLGDDEKFRELLHCISEHFYQRVVSSQEFENYLERQTGLTLAPFFDQYLRDVRIPQFTYQIKDGRLYYRWEKVTKGFAMPLDIKAGVYKIRLVPDEYLQSIPWNHKGNIEVSSDFYVSSAPEKLVF